MVALEPPTSALISETDARSNQALLGLYPGEKPPPYTTWAMPGTPWFGSDRTFAVSVSGYGYMPNAMVRRKVGASRRAHIGAGLRRSCGLTPAEWRAVQGLARGFAPAEIATSLGVSVHTVRTQLKRAMAKAGVHSQIALVVRVYSGR